MTRAQRDREDGQLSESAGRGRPRDSAVSARILASTRALLVDVGYNRLSFEMVAQASGVTRPVLYRRWPSKAHLVFEATLPDALDGIADTADLAADIRGFITRCAAMFSDPVYRTALPGLLADFSGKPEFEQSVMSGLWTTIRAGFAARIEQAFSRGEISGQIEALDVLDVIIGGLFQRVLVLQEPHQDYIDTLTGIALRLLASQ